MTMAKVLQMAGTLFLLRITLAMYIDNYGSRDHTPFAQQYLGLVTKVLHKLSKPNSTDAVIMFDTSNGISRSTFNVMKSLCLAALSCLDRQIKNTRIAMVAFGNSVKKIMHFDDCKNKECLSQSLKKIKMMNSPNRALGQALRYSRRLFRKYGRRPNRIIVLVTFGPSNKGRGAKIVAKKLKKNNNAEIFVVAVGRDAVQSRDELYNMAGTSSKDERPLGHFYLKNEQRFYLEMSAATGFVRRICRGP